KVNLQVARSSDRDELSAHANAFRMVVEEVAAAMTQDQVTGPQGMQHLGDAIETGIDDYLDKRHIDTRIDGVVFDELMLMP
ncbi:MAG TPA: hypothetical protein VEQ09_05700, partial [Aquabacterium sp.]|nr:hypothetical protein [Aquabacterium sp.]